jgi:hypothetical protein
MLRARKGKLYSAAAPVLCFKSRRYTLLTQRVDARASTRCFEATEVLRIALGVCITNLDDTGCIRAALYATGNQVIDDK